MEGKVIIDLPNIMSQLNIGEQQKTLNITRTEDIVIPEEMSRNIRASLRKQVRPVYCENPKRRCSLKPTKLKNQSGNYYLNRKSDRRSGQCLETIYEEPNVQRNGDVKLLGAKKSRKIMFRVVSKAKSKRKKVAQKKQTLGNIKRSKKLNMDEFVTHLRAIMEA